jgi:hypothetical protein
MHIFKKMERIILYNKNRTASSLGTISQHQFHESRAACCGVIKHQKPNAAYKTRTDEAEPNNAGGSQDDRY